MWRTCIVLLSLFVAGFCSAETETVDFTDEEKAYTSNTTWKGKDGWLPVVAEVTKPCRARRMGVGVRPGNGITRTFDVPEPIVSITVKCVASTDDAVKQSLAHALTLTCKDANGNDLEVVEPQKTLDFETKFEAGVEGTIVPLTFDLKDTSAPVASLTLLNTTGDSGKIYEISSVTLSTSLPEIEVVWHPPSQAQVDKPFYITIESISNVTVNTTANLCLKGYEPQIPVAIDEPTSIEMTAPVLSGEYTLSLVVTDPRRPKSVSFDKTLRVYSQLPAELLPAQEIKQNSFKVAWVPSTTDTATAFRVQVRPKQMVELAEEIITLSGTPTVITLSEAVYTAHLSTTVACEVYDETTGEWTAALSAPGYIILGTGPKIHQIRTKDGSEVEVRLTRTFKSLPWVYDNEIKDSAEYTCLVEGLLAGKTYEVRLTTFYGSDSNLDLPSDLLVVTTEPLPTFKAIERDSTNKMLGFTWPEGDNLTGRIEYWCETVADKETSDGLYLTAVLLTNGPASKALVISNNTSQECSLEGYTLLSSRERTDAEVAAGKTEPIKKQWDFKLEDGTYPSVPARGSLVIYAAQYTLPETLDTLPHVLLTKQSALSTITASYTVALYKGETVVNAMTPELGAIKYLATDSLDTELTATVDDPTVLPSALTYAWSPGSQQSRYKVQNLSRSASYVYYSLPTFKYLQCWAEATVVSGENVSSVYRVQLDPIETKPAKQGYRIRFR